MAEFDVRYQTPDGEFRRELVEADWKHDVERRYADAGYTVLAITNPSKGDSIAGANQAKKDGFWSFRTFIAPSWICALFVLNVFSVFLYSAYSIYAIVDRVWLSAAPSTGYSYSGSVDSSETWAIVYIVGIAVISAVYLIGLRITLEFVIVIFRIYDEVKSVRKRLG